MRPASTLFFILAIIIVVQDSVCINILDSLLEAGDLELTSGALLLKLNSQIEAKDTTWTKTRRSLGLCLRWIAKLSYSEARVLSITADQTNAKRSSNSIESSSSNDSSSSSSCQAVQEELILFLKVISCFLLTPWMLAYII